MPREVITLQIGQAGIRTGRQVWELYCLDHDIDPSNERLRWADPTDPKTRPKADENLQQFFHENQEGQLIPRTIFVDLDPSTLDEIRVSEMRNFFHCDSFIQGKEDSAGNFARGYCTVGREIIDITMDRIRKLADECEGLQGFMLLHSMGGGTGSGFGSMLAERIDADYGRKTKHQYSVFPATQVSTCILEPYNTVLATHKMLDHIDFGLMFDNDAEYEQCRRHFDIERPCYADLNQLILQVIACSTYARRTGGSLNAELREFHSTAVPYPRIHWCIASHAPFWTAEKTYCFRHTVTELTEEIFKPESWLARCDPRAGKYMAISLTYRGDVVPRDVNEAIRSIKTKGVIQFVDWSPTGFKCGINYASPTVLPNGILSCLPGVVTAIANTTSVSEVFSRITSKFDLLWSKRAFVHWMLMDGLEECELSESREDLAALEMDYKELAEDMTEDAAEEEQPSEV